MTDQNAEQRVEVIQQDRDAAADLKILGWRADGMSETNARGMAQITRLGKIDHCDEVQAFARHRLTFAATARAEVVEECARAIRRAGERVASIETPRMEGDNFAVTLCSHFDDGEGEQDEWGWTEAATAGYEEVISAIREHFNTAIRNLAPPSAEADFCVAAGPRSLSGYDQSDAAVIERARAEAERHGFDAAVLALRGWARNRLGVGTNEVLEAAADDLASHKTVILATTEPALDAREGG